MALNFLILIFASKPVPVAFILESETEGLGFAESEPIYPAFNSFPRKSVFHQERKSLGSTIALDISKGLAQHTEQNQQMFVD